MPPDIGDPEPTGFESLAVPKDKKKMPPDIGDPEPTGFESLAVPKDKKNAAYKSGISFILMRHRGFEPRTT